MGCTRSNSDADDRAYVTGSSATETLFTSSSVSGMSGSAWHYDGHSLLNIDKNWGPRNQLWLKSFTAQALEATSAGLSVPLTCFHWFASLCWRINDTRFATVMVGTNLPYRIRSELWDECQADGISVYRSTMRSWPAGKLKIYRGSLLCIPFSLGLV